MILGKKTSKLYTVCTHTQKLFKQNLKHAHLPGEEKKPYYTRQALLPSFPHCQHVCVRTFPPHTPFNTLGCSEVKAVSDSDSENHSPFNPTVFLVFFVACLQFMYKFKTYGLAGLWTSNTSSIWELVGNTNYKAPTETHKVKICILYAH